MSQILGFKASGGLRIRALVLAAGRGQRLRPLTGFVPKPLLPVVGRPVLEHTLTRLAVVECEAVAINLHHLGDQVRSAIGESFEGMPITYSSEKELLGTWGAFAPLRDFFRPADLVILINGDSLCRWPLGAMIRRHRETGADATLLVSERADPARYGGGIAVEPDGLIRDFAPPGSSGRGSPAVEVKRRVFAGAHVFSPALLERFGPGLENSGRIEKSQIEKTEIEGKRIEKAEIVPALYEPLLSEGSRLVAFGGKGRWHDLGTPRRYLEGSLDWARGRGPQRLWKRRNLARDVSLARGSRVRRSVLESGVQVEAGALVEDSVVLAEGTVGAGSRLRASVIAPGVELPAGSTIEGRLVTPLRAGRDPGARDSVVGRLVFTPIDPL